MASAVSKPDFLNVREYLRTSYTPDCEYVDGGIQERNVGEFDPAFLQALFVQLFLNHEAAWGVLAVPEQRVQVAPTRFRVPDVCILRRGNRREQIITTPPIICIEILSPEDSLQAMKQRVDDYLAFGLMHIWIVDPGLRIAYRATSSGFEQVLDGELRVPESSIHVQIASLFAELDRI